jgi:hypothetical protein
MHPFATSALAVFGENSDVDLPTAFETGDPATAVSTLGSVGTHRIAPLFSLHI